jgi:hypothetical protein
MAVTLQDAGMGFAAPGWAEGFAPVAGAGVSLLVAFLLQVFQFGLIAGMTGAVARQFRAEG